MPVSRPTTRTAVLERNPHATYSHRDFHVLSAALELTAACNHRCAFCSNAWKNPRAPPRPTSRAELSAAEWARVMDVLYDLGVREFVLTGGEPTLHPGFADVLRHATSKAETSVVVISNGDTTTFDDAELCRFMAEHYVTVGVSVHGGPERHARATGTAPSSLTRTLATIRRLRAANVDVCANVVVGGGDASAGDALEAARVAVEQGGVKYLLAMRPLQVGALSKQATAESTTSEARLFASCTAAEFRVALDELLEYGRSKGCQVAVGCTTPVCVVPELPGIDIGRSCGCGVLSVAIDPQGWLRPCTTEPTLCGSVFESTSGDITAKAVLDACRSSSMAQFRARARTMDKRENAPLQCTRCCHRDECTSGCPASQVDGVVCDPMMPVLVDEGSVVDVEDLQQRLALLGLAPAKLPPQHTTRARTTTATKHKTP